MNGNKADCITLNYSTCSTYSSAKIQLFESINYVPGLPAYLGTKLIESNNWIFRELMTVRIWKY